jgi:hypothetical protein
MPAISKVESKSIISSCFSLPTKQQTTHAHVVTGSNDRLHSKKSATLLVYANGTSLHSSLCASLKSIHTRA